MVFRNLTNLFLFLLRFAGAHPRAQRDHTNASEERRLPVPQARNHDQKTTVVGLLSGLSKGVFACRWA